MTADVALSSLDDLWFQISGTLCNLTCRHCFISCSPTNRSFEPLARDDVLRALEDSRKLVVKEYYFTGGEPFIHPELEEILTRTLAIGPATVLTNGTLLKERVLARLAAVEAASLYSLEFRLSLDGYSPETNDPIRGEGTFERAMKGLRLLVEHGFLPIVTVAQSWDEGQNDAVLERFVSLLRREGYSRPRIKIIPTLRIGAEVERSRGYHASEKLTSDMMADYDASQLICSHSRIVTNRGVYVCPILIDTPEARMGSSIAQTLGSFSLDHGACYTCYVGGSICSNASSGGAVHG